MFQPPAPYSHGFVTQGKWTIYVSGQVGLAALLNPGWLVEVEAIAVVD